MANTYLTRSTPCVDEVLREVVASEEIKTPHLECADRESLSLAGDRTISAQRCTYICRSTLSFISKTA
jgi:hypothetical protein